MHTQLFVVCSFFEGSNSYSINHRGTLVECSPLTHCLACKGIANSQFKTGTQSFSSSPPALELCIPAFTSAKPVFGFVQSNSELFTPCPQTIWNHIQRSSRANPCWSRISSVEHFHILVSCNIRRVFHTAVNYVSGPLYSYSHNYCMPICSPRLSSTLENNPCHHTTDTAVNNGHGSGGAELTTSTVFSTRTATITACPSSVTNCPLRSKTTYVTTETLVVSTTVCPVADITGSSGAIITTQTASHPSATVAVVDNWSSMGGYDITTSTILSTRVITVTACPSSVTNCPLRSKTTYASTETLVVATTVYPVPKVTNTKAKTPLPSVTRASEEGPSLTTSTILSTRIATVASCTGDDCRSSSSDSYVTTETLVVGTTVYTVYPEYVSVPTEGVDAMAAPTTAATLLQTANSAGSSPKVVSSGSQPTSASETSTQGTGSSAGSSAESSEGSDAGSAADSSAVSGAGSGAAADTTYTTTIIVESCSNDGTCTEYGSTITMAQTSNLAQPTVPPSPYSYTSYLGSGLGWNHSTPVSSAHVWPQSSHQAGMSTAMVTSTRSASAVNALYTGSASAGSQWSMLQVVGMAVAILTAVLV
ncbi:hypothetical protein CBS147343_3294 [Aspergillus niger]|nr:hypothetical protein CBS147320_7600 [Aspergillus niger]KAI2987871.1 hypothetical protein CBS147344_4363 [Aspergillus niger]KAI2989437.1 hypothetical protein CBS147482_9289 [Aspergillus niger]KAI3080276.1 hypothetical protein CBS147343_3294 [Aspergillus niger]